MEEYLTVTQFGELHNMDVGLIRRQIAAGRIPAVKLGNQWAIPTGTPRPTDLRVKSGKYKDWRKPKKTPPA